MFASNTGLLLTTSQKSCCSTEVCSNSIPTTSCVKAHQAPVCCQVYFFSRFFFLKILCQLSTFILHYPHCVLYQYICCSFFQGVCPNTIYERIGSYYRFCIRGVFSSVSVLHDKINLIVRKTYLSQSFSQVVTGK